MSTGGKSSQISQEGTQQNSEIKDHQYLIYTVHHPTLPFRQLITRISGRIGRHYLLRTPTGKVQILHSLVEGDVNVYFFLGETDNSVP